MKLEDIGDPALVKRVGVIIYAAYPSDEMDYDEWFAKWDADEQGALHFGIFALDALDEIDLSEHNRADLIRYREYISLALDVADLNGPARAA